MAQSKLAVPAAKTGQAPKQAPSGKPKSAGFMPGPKKHRN